MIVQWYSMLPLFLHKKNNNSNAESFLTNKTIVKFAVDVSNFY